MNLYGSSIKLEYEGTGITEVYTKDFLYLDSSTILFQVPNVKNIPYYYSRWLKISVSNNGINYSPEAVYFTYFEEPTLISIKNDTSDLAGGMTCTIIGTHFTADVTKCIFGAT